MIAFRPITFLGVTFVTYHFGYIFNRGQSLSIQAARACSRRRPKIDVTGGSVRKA
jgi:hypothetical protein